MVSSKKLAKTRKTAPQMRHRNHVDTPAPRPWSKASDRAEPDTFLPVSEAGRRPTRHSQESRQQQALLRKAAGRPDSPLQERGTPRGWSDLHLTPPLTRHKPQR